MEELTTVIAETETNGSIGDVLAGSDNEFIAQIGEDWDALIRMLQYLIEFFKSLFGIA